MTASYQFPASLVIDQTIPMNTFIDYICEPYGLGYYFDGSGTLVPVDLRQPTSLSGISTITNADLAVEAPSWRHDPASAITSTVGTYYAESQLTDSVTLAELAARVGALIDDLHATAGHGLIGSPLVDESPFTIIDVDEIPDPAGRRQSRAHRRRSNPHREAVKRALDDELQWLDRLFIQILALRDEAIERVRNRQMGSPS